MLQKIIPGLLILSLVGCQSFPEPEPAAPAKPATEKPKPQTPDGVVITPYDRPEIKRQKIVIPEQKPKNQKFDDGRNLPAFKRLMQQTQQAYANTRADAFALRGLSYAQSNAMKKQLWQVRLKAAQQQKNTKAIQNAQQALKGL